MEPTCSVPPSPPLLSEERHRSRSNITSCKRTAAAAATTTTTTAASTTRSKQTTYNPVRSLVARYRQVAPVNTRIVCVCAKFFSPIRRTLELWASAAVSLPVPFPILLGTAGFADTAEVHVYTHVRQREGLSLFPSRFARNRESAIRIDERRRCSHPALR
ncbi:hypothetical protein ALC60_01320 [Trachymyrmex zeteki]|uniref:Uncharacterized protein n=1 Tax=Mycetomoellerius zeteki TaxID=64791 RepID=A0A151XGX5_9HYME|nr:hypothetical protein ALC60_01320 [Trachymyrmex zeteki]